MNQNPYRPPLPATSIEQSELSPEANPNQTRNAIRLAIVTVSCMIIAWASPSRWISVAGWLVVMALAFADDQRIPKKNAGDF